MKGYVEDKLTLEQALNKCVFKDVIKDEHPIKDQLSMYVQAHLAYFDTLSYKDIAEYKIQWGLRKILKIT